MSLVENLQIWKDAVQLYREGDFQSSVNKFKEMNDLSARILFNIARAHLSLCDLQSALQTFKEVIQKDEHLAIGHFMLGVVYLMCTRHQDALVSFNKALHNLRGCKFIDYKQLGMRHKLYKCEVLLNRAVCHSSLGNNEIAVKDLLAALQCKAEPRHNIIDVSLSNLQSGLGMEFLVVDAIFQPPKSKTANLEKRDYLGKSQVVVDNGAYELMTPANLSNRINTSSSTRSLKSGEQYRVLYDFTAQNANEVSIKAGDVITVIETADDGWFTMITNDPKKTGLVPGSYLEKCDKSEVPFVDRQALLTDLRKKETRHSLRRVQFSQHKPSITSGRRFTSPNENHIYVNGAHDPPEKEPLTTAVRAGNGSPKLPSSHANTLHSGPPKFRRHNSLENLLSNKKPGSPPSFVKTLPTDLLRTSQKIGGDDHDDNEDDDDEGEYEEIPDSIKIKPYAVHDVVSMAERVPRNGRMVPDRPAPPPKVGATRKTREFSPPGVTKRSPGLSKKLELDSVTDQKPGIKSLNGVPKPSKPPPKVPPPKLPPNGRRGRENENRGKEAGNQKVTLQFVVDTHLNLTPSTTLEDIQKAAKDAIIRNNPSHLWCEKDGKKVRIGAWNPLNLVEDGTLKIFCNPQNLK